MGSCCVKQELTEEDIHFLKKHTRYDEETIREWYAGFLQVLGWTKVILHLGTAIKGSACIFL